MIHNALLSLHQQKSILYTHLTSRPPSRLGHCYTTFIRAVHYQIPPMNLLYYLVAYTIHHGYLPGRLSSVRKTVSTMMSNLKKSVTWYDPLKCIHVIRDRITAVTHDQMTAL